MRGSTCLLSWLVLDVACRLCVGCSWMVLVLLLCFAQPLIWIIQHSDEWCCCLSAQCDPVVGTEQKINMLTEMVSDCDALPLHWSHFPNFEHF